MRKRTDRRPTDLYAHLSRVTPNVEDSFSFDPGRRKESYSRVTVDERDLSFGVVARVVSIGVGH